MTSDLSSSTPSSAAAGAAPVGQFLPWDDPDFLLNPYPWFAEAQQAIEDEQAGEFSSVKELIANTQRQAPLYFHRWEGNERIGRELFADFAHSEPLHQFNTTEFATLDLRPELRKIAAPTLVLAGDDDMIAGPVCGGAIARELSDGKFVTIPETGHFLYVEQPEAFRAALTDFLL